MKYRIIIVCFLLSGCISSKAYKEGLVGIYELHVMVGHTSDEGSILTYKNHCSYFTDKRLIKGGKYKVKIQIPQNTHRDSLIPVDLIYYRRIPIERKYYKH